MYSKKSIEPNYSDTSALPYFKIFTLICHNPFYIFPPPLWQPVMFFWKEKKRFLFQEPAIWHHLSIFNIYFHNCIINLNSMCLDLRLIYIQMESVLVYKVAECSCIEHKKINMLKLLKVREYLFKFLNLVLKFLSKKFTTSAMCLYEQTNSCL